jgi:hypothetical protein
MSPSVISISASARRTDGLGVAGSDCDDFRSVASGAVPYRWSIPGLSRLPPMAGSTLLSAVTISSSAWDSAPRSASSFFADNVRPALDAADDRRLHRDDLGSWFAATGTTLHSYRSSSRSS